jgi:undecaprenyl-diphosphatase
MRTVMFRSILCALPLVAVFIGIALTFQQQLVARFDLHVIHLVQGVSFEEMTPLMKGFTAVGSGPWVVGIAVLLSLVLGALGYRRELIFFGGVIIGSSVLNLLLKGIFHRARPDIHRIIEAAGYSFPSGHSMSAFTMYGITIYFLWKHLRRGWVRTGVAMLCLFMVVMIGLSRIYLGVHYPSDVIGGYFISAAWLTLVIGWYEHALKERFSRKKRLRVERRTTIK